MTVEIVNEAEDTNLAYYLETSASIDRHDSDDTVRRHRAGQRILDERKDNGGKQLPHGRMEQICITTGKSEAEIKNWAQFAEEVPEEEVANMLATYENWRGIVNDGLGQRGSGSHLTQQSITNEWYTPAVYVEAARTVMGSIDLDPASNDSANEAVVKAAVYYTEETDGLEHPWSGNVWLNPPYGGIAADFVERVVTEYEDKNVKSAIVLLNAHVTDTKYFQPLFDYPMCFTDHRINFEAGTEKRSGSTHGSVFVYLGTAPARFAKTFAQFGSVVRRMT